jgi:phosphoglycerate dehydrogenase-like enzyme
VTEAKVLFIHGVHPKVVDAITSYTPDGFRTEALSADTPEELLIEASRDADFIVLHPARIADNVLRAATHVRMVQILSAGFDGLNLDLIHELEVPCANNGGANSWAVSDHAVLLMLAVYKRLVVTDASTRDGRWGEPITGLNTFEMANKLVGILGIGNIGRQVARRVQAFDAQVQYYDKYPLSEERERELNIERVSLEELFRSSDILTCHTPLTSETERIVNAQRLGMMKPTAVLINTSRGGVVDEGALIDALNAGTIAGAGLDVFEQEPVDPDNPLLKMDNVIATPHAAGGTWDTWFRRAEFAYANIARVWAGDEPQSLLPDYEG